MKEGHIMARHPGESGAAWRRAAMLEMVKNQAQAKNTKLFLVAVLVGHCGTVGDHIPDDANAP